MIEFKVLFGFCFKTDGLTDEQMNGRTDKWMNKWTERHLQL